MSKAGQIIKRFFESEQPEKIKMAFSRWLIHPVSTEEKDKALYEQWSLIQAIEYPSTEKSYEQVAQRLGFFKRRTIRSISISIARIAALFIVPILSLAMAYWYTQTLQPEELSLVEYFVPDGEIREILLPDNSKVTLNSGSTLIYPKDFKGKSRNMYLSGEAEFVVTKDPDKAFIVKTKDMDICALGTTFNVSAYSDNRQTIATLIHGSIQVDLKNGENSFVLSSPEEQLVYDEMTSSAICKTARTDYVLAWKKGQMIFQSASLYTVIKAIERHYQVVIYLNSADLSDEKLTVKFLNNETLDETLYTLKQIIKGFHYKIEKDKIYIY